MKIKSIKPNAIKVQSYSFGKTVNYLKISSNQLRTANLSADIFKSANNTKYNPKVGA